MRSDDKSEGPSFNCAGRIDWAHWVPYDDSLKRYLSQGLFTIETTDACPYTFITLPTFRESCFISFACHNFHPQSLRLYSSILAGPSGFYQPRLVTTESVLTRGISSKNRLSLFLSPKTQKCFSPDQTAGFHAKVLLGEMPAVPVT